MVRRIRRALWIFILLVVGGLLGLVTWIITGGAAAYAWYVYGGAAAVTTAGIVGKVTSPLWVKGMARVAEKHCPKFHNRMERLWNFLRRNWVQILVITFWAVVLVGLPLYITFL